MIPPQFSKGPQQSITSGWHWPPLQPYWQLPVLCHWHWPFKESRHSSWLKLLALQRIVPAGKLSQKQAALAAGMVLVGAVSPTKLLVSSSLFNSCPDWAIWPLLVIPNLSANGIWPWERETISPPKTTTGSRGSKTSLNLFRLAKYLIIKTTNFNIMNLPSHFNLGIFAI